MSNDIVRIMVLIVVVTIVAVLVSNRAQTVAVIKGLSDLTSFVFSKAVSPINAGVRYE